MFGNGNCFGLSGEVREGDQWAGNEDAMEETQSIKEKLAKVTAWETSKTWGTRRKKRQFSKIQECC